jgi:phage terminase large subunit GpA-like protein
MKGVQLGLTVGVLENAIGYFIEHVKCAPMMMVTADAELAKIRMETSITTMLRHSELDHLIKSSDESNARKTGRTDKKVEWVGGGYMVPVGAQNPAKLRSLPIQIVLRDEVDAWPDVVGKDGDPMKLSADRAAAYESSRKILDISTPLIKGHSKIAKRFDQGDQRYYFVCCLKCGHSQTLRWRRTNTETGEESGIVWELDDKGQLKNESVRYLCEKCFHPHTNDDKTRLLSPENGAEWRPTAIPVNPDHRSYHINALYSPVGMQTWTACVLKWLEAWDVQRNQPKDFGALQVFYNNVLGEPFAQMGERVKFETVSGHRRRFYQFGEVPNKHLIKHCGSPVLLLTCAVDVHKDNLAVAVFGWCAGRRAVLVDYWRFEGDTSQLADGATWGRLHDLIAKEYVGDDGKHYNIALTLIDSGYLTDQVYQFCSEYESGVSPVKGRDLPPKSATVKEFADFETPMGTRAYTVTVDLYKDRWSAALRKQWDEQSIQPTGHFNAPMNATDAQLKELTVETKVKRVQQGTDKELGYEWKRPSGANNELWDCLVYNNAALDLLAWDTCRNELGEDHVDWLQFYSHIERHKKFFEEPSTK